MRLPSILCGAALVWAAMATASPAASAVTTATVNLRAGPGSGYAVIVAVPASQPVVVSGCVAGRAWCDAAWGGYRGWVSSAYIRYAGAYVAPAPVVVYQPPVVYGPRPVYGAGWADARRDARVERRVNRRWDRWTGD